MDAVQIARTALNVFSSLLPAPANGQPAPRTLEDLSLDDLRREKVRLEVEERKCVARLRDLEGDKHKLFEEGVRNVSEREQRLLARRIKALDLEAKNLDRNLEFMSRQMRIIGGFVQLKENQRLLAEAGVTSLIQGIDLQTLQVYVDRASVDGEFHMDKFSEILAALESAAGSVAPAHEDADVLEIVRAMQQAREASEAAHPVGQIALQAEAAGLPTLTRQAD